MKVLTDRAHRSTHRNLPSSSRTRQQDPSSKQWAGVARVRVNLIGRFERRSQGFTPHRKTFRTFPAAANQHSRDGMLIYQMLQRAGLQYERVLVKALHLAGKLHATQQVDSDMFIAL